MERKPLTRNSRPMMMTAIHAGTRLGLNWDESNEGGGDEKFVGHGIEQDAPWW